MGTKNDPGEFDCYARAHPDEPLFTLLGRDRLAPGLVRLWAALRSGEAIGIQTQILALISIAETGKPVGLLSTREIAKRNEAIAVATDMESWREYLDEGPTPLAPETPFTGDGVEVTEVERSIRMRWPDLDLRTHQGPAPRFVLSVDSPFTIPIMRLLLAAQRNDAGAMHDAFCDLGDQSRGHDAGCYDIAAIKSIKAFLVQAWDWRAKRYHHSEVAAPAPPPDDPVAGAHGQDGGFFLQPAVEAAIRRVAARLRRKMAERRR